MHHHMKFFLKKVEMKPQTVLKNTYVTVGRNLAMTFALLVVVVVEEVVVATTYTINKRQQNREEIRVETR
jgi:flagellar biosynthesis protein FlhB